MSGRTASAPLFAAPAAPAATPAPLRSRLGLARVLAHLGMWRSAACSLKERPQCGHGTRLGSGAEGGGRGTLSGSAPEASGNQGAA